MRRKNNIIDFMRIYCFFIWRNLNPPHARMLCAKISWNWLSGSGGEDFLISSKFFHYFVIISSWKGWGLLFVQTWIPFTQGYIVTSLVKIGPVVLEKRNYLPLEKGGAHHLKRIEFPSPKDALKQVWLKLGQCFWRRRFLNFVNIFSLFRNYLSLEKGGVLHLNKSESPLPKDALCPVWLKLAL